MRMANSHDILDQHRSTGIPAYLPVKVANSFTTGVQKMKKEILSNPHMPRFKLNMSLETIRTDPQDNVNDSSEGEMDAAVADQQAREV